jgi:hypothetical protein
MKKFIIVLMIIVLTLTVLAAIGWQRLDVQVEDGKGRYLIHDYLHITNSGTEMKNLNLSIRVYREDGTSEFMQENFPIWKKHEKKVIPIDLGWSNKVTKCEFNASYDGGRFKQETDN